MNFENWAARDGFLVGIALLTIVSGALTVLSGLPLLNLPSGSVRDQNFMPVPTQTLAFIAVEFAVLGMIIVGIGAMFLVVPGWRRIWGGAALGLSAGTFLGAGVGSTSIVVLASVMGVVGGLLGIFYKRLKISETRSSTEDWLRAFPFVLVGVGLWEYSGIFLGCGPPAGIGTGACELLAPSFYIVAMLVIAAVLSVMAVPVWEAINRRYHGS